MPYDNLFAAALARKAKVQPDSVPVLPEASTSRSDILASVGAPMPEFNTGKVFQALDQPRNQLFKILSGIDKERVGGTDVLEKIGMKPGIGREALGLVMDTGADPMNALTGVPSAIKKIKDIRRLADLAKSTQTVAPLLNEGVSVARSNLLDAVESPAFQRQGRSVEGIEDLLGAQRSLADKTPIAAPDLSPESLGLSVMSKPVEGQPEAVSSLVERMMAARKAAPEDLSIIQQSYGDLPGNTAQDLLRESRRTEQELIRAKQQAAKEALLRELAPQPVSGTPASSGGVIEGLKKLGYSDAEIVKMTGPERQNLWELGAPSPSSFERELAESLDTPGAGMVETPSISTGLEVDVPKSGTSVPKKGTVKTKKSKASDILTGQK